MTSRRPKGTPTGGQFAPGARAEVNVELAEEPVRSVWPDGSVRWQLHGVPHRTDGGPAIVRPDGTQEWYQHGRRHREDGPAIVHTDGTEEWWQNDLLHREDGPAVVWPDGCQLWFARGEPISVSAVR